MAKQLILYRTVAGTQDYATGVLGTGSNESNVFVAKTGRSGSFELSFTKDGLTSFVAILQALSSDNSTWTDVRDYAGAAVSVFGTVNSTRTLNIPIWLGGPDLPAGVPLKLVLTVTGTPSGNDSVRIAYNEAA